MAAHLFVFYFSVISNITPPVAVSCFAAAPLAGANPTKVGTTAFRLAIAAYIVPFVFCFEPTLIMIGEPGMILLNVCLCAYAIFAICIALSGYWQRKVSMVRRLLLCVAAAVVLWPTEMAINLTGVVVLTALLFPDMRLSVMRARERRMAKKNAAET